MSFARRAVVVLLFAVVVLPAPATLAGQQQGAAAAPEADAAQEGQTIDLSLIDAVEMALRHNLQVRISAFSPELQRESITSQRARFDPTVTLNVPTALSRDTSQGTTQLSGADVLTTERISGGFSFSHLLEYGTNWSINWSSTRSFTNNTFSNFNPNYSSNLTLNVTQPLLRGFGKEFNRTPILVAQNDLAVSREQFRDAVQGVVLQVYRAYWQLVFAARDLEVKRLSLDLARQQLDRNRVQVEIGTLAPIETIQAEQQVATNELSLTQAEQTLADAQDDLRRLLNLEAALSNGWEVDVNPTDEPEVRSDEIDLSATIDEAYENDPTLRQRRLQLDSRRLNVQSARNGLLPQLNFTGGLTLSGQGGDLIIRGGSFGGDQNILEIQEGGFSDALSNMLSGNFRNWSVGLQLVFPINNWAAKAQHAQAVINERSVLTQIADREQGLRVDITKAVRQVTSGAQQVAQATVARELAERQLDAEERKFAVGTTTNFEVLRFQRDLATARTQELQAITAYMNSLAQLEQLKGTLLESLGVGIGIAGVPSGTR